MGRPRVIAACTIVAVLVAGGAAWGVTAGRDRQAAANPPVPSTADRPPTTKAPSTSTTVATTTSSTEAPEPAGPVGLTLGASGPEVEWLQARLTELRFDPGPVDGRFGGGTLQALWAFQKIQGFPVDQTVTPEVRAALESPAPIAPLVPDGGSTRIEVDLARQVMFVYRDDELRLVTHVSTGHGGRYCAPGGCGTAITPIGSFRFMWRVSGWRTSRLGQLYNPVYFTGSGIAVHGAHSVPAHPASAGCVRIAMHIAEYFPTLVARGDPVYVTDGRPIAPLPPAGSEPPPEGPPPDDGPATTTTTSSTTSTTSTTSSTTTTTSTVLPPDDDGGGDEEGGDAEPDA